MLTATKKLGLAGLALVSLGASVAYYATVMTFQGHPISQEGLNYFVLAAVAAMTAVVLLSFWRSLNRSIQKIAQQLDQMRHTGEIGLVMTDATEDLESITRPMNELLTAMRNQLDQLRAENRELQIQSRIAAAEKNSPARCEKTSTGSSPTARWFA